jgi:hypothetical protein
MVDASARRWLPPWDLASPYTTMTLKNFPHILVASPSTWATGVVEVRLKSVGRSTIESTARSGHDGCQVCRAQAGVRSAQGAERLLPAAEDTGHLPKENGLVEGGKRAGVGRTSQTQLPHRPAATRNAIGRRVQGYTLGKRLHDILGLVAAADTYH